MSPAEILALAKALEALVGAVSGPEKPKPWRWGHGFTPVDNQCVYCGIFIPGKVRRTRRPCSGPDHQLEGRELGR